MGRLSVTIERTTNIAKLEYKFNRGNWKKVEGDNFGNDIENRFINTENVDTIYVEIKSWRDTYNKFSLWD